MRRLTDSMMAARGPAVAAAGVWLTAAALQLPALASPVKPVEPATSESVPRLKLTLAGPVKPVVPATAPTPVSPTTKSNRAGGGTGPAAAAGPRPLGCLIEPYRVADLGSPVVGVVERMMVERGDDVRAGQPLVALRDEVETANARAAKTRASIDAEILAATAALDLARQKHKRATTLVAEGFVSDQAVEQARSEADVARQRVVQARGQQRIWSDEKRVADAQLALRTVRSPFDGVVVERFVTPGERVEDRPLLRVVTINPLRVELMVPTSQYGTLAVGDRITIRPELPGVEPMHATVRRMDRVLDAASNSFRVSLTLPNPGNKLPAGLRCKADLPGAATTSPAPVPSAPGGSTPRSKPVALNGFTER